MAKALMLYASRTGRTEIMAQEMMQQLNERQIQITTKKFGEDNINVNELLDYDKTFIGVYTWADGELPVEADDFFDHIHTLDLRGKTCGVFGSADSSYEEFGTAVEIMYEELEEAGATMVPDQIIYELEPDEDALKRSIHMVDTACNL